MQVIRVHFRADKLRILQKRVFRSRVLYRKKCKALFLPNLHNSLSSKAFNMASIRFLHSLPLFWDG